jgi:hypothetical protein
VVVGIKNKKKVMIVDLIEKDLDDFNKRVYYVLIDFEDGNDPKMIKMNEIQLKKFSKMLYSKVIDLNIE